MRLTDIIQYIILICIFALVAVYIFRSMRKSRENENQCFGCTDCPIGREKCGISAEKSPKNQKKCSNNLHSKK